MKRALLWFAYIFLLNNCTSEGEFSHADVYIKNALIIDGTGAKGFQGEIILQGDSILYIGSPLSKPVKAKKIINAGGRVVSPGFIDSHAHGDPFVTPLFENFIYQGVTTILLGQDGSGPKPDSLDTWLEKITNQKFGVNIAYLAGHGTLRNSAGVPLDGVPDSIQLMKMVEYLNRSIDAGYFGMSTGLEYIPGLYSKDEELLALAKILGRRGGIIMSHMRNEDDYAVEESMRELMRQGSYCKVHIAHWKVVYGKGKERAGELLKLLDSARQEGIDISADIYPYTASYTGIGIVFPEWAKQPFNYSEVLKLRRKELKEYLTERINYRNGPEATLFGTEPWSGLTLKFIADSLKKDFADVLIDNIGPGGASGAYFVMHAPLQETLIQHPSVVVSSDGSPTMRHPRGYGSFSKVIEEYILQKELFSLEAGIHKMTGKTAEILGIKDRGTLIKGNKADIVIFDSKNIKTKATFENPFQNSEGIDYLFVNGQEIIEEGVYNKEKGGIFISKIND